MAPYATLREPCHLTVTFRRRKEADTDVRVIGIEPVSTSTRTNPHYGRAAPQGDSLGENHHPHSSPAWVNIIPIRHPFPHIPAMSYKPYLFEEN